MTWARRCVWPQPLAETAPFRADLAEAPDGGHIVWRRAADGIRLRLGVWHAEKPRGTVFLFPGRTEYLEKYGRVISDLTTKGWSVISIDWRGQGLSDRLFDDGRLGHIADFSDYQQDVAVLSAWAQELALPEPHVMVAHSMGGCIGLRSLCDGLPVSRAVFSAPMWGIQMPAYARPLTYVIPPIARLAKQETKFAPGTKPTNYVTDTDFQENMLTSDLETYTWLGQHAAEAPEFALGGPSIQWVGAATKENNQLMAQPRPSQPVLTFVGTNEQIVSIDAIKKLHASWPSGELRMVEDAKHEMMMETPTIRGRFIAESLEFLAGS